MAACVAGSAPAFCAACFAARPDVAHVDLGAAYDGPVLRDDAGVPQSIDDLIVCAGCVHDAARALAINVAPVDDVTRQLAAAQADARAWREYAEGLEDAVARRPEPVKRGPGRPPARAARPEQVAA